MDRHYEDPSELLKITEIGPWKVGFQLARALLENSEEWCSTGAVLSPLLFNIMMYDTPVAEGMYSYSGLQCSTTGFTAPISVSYQTNENVLQMYHELIDTNYFGYTHIFTDGSCIVDPTYSASAAVVIPSRGATINFKLRPQIHIMECELIAINEALQWIVPNNCQEEEYVIFSDSLSSLHLIQSTRPKNDLPLVFNIQDKLFNIASSHWVYLQFIPGHKDIPGNEAADEAAINAHLLRYRTLTPSSNEVKNLINTAFKTKWKTEWLRSIQLTGKGRHLLKIQDNTGQWPWSAHKTRSIETALAHLRVGHTGLRSHLYRFSIVEDP
ncbi:Ribonuclease H domain [Trinorchestia longiramus]|nr:Ribonuclease H domain [Trinorchestia longiramus]